MFNTDVLVMSETGITETAGGRALLWRRVSRNAHWALLTQPPVLDGLIDIHGYARPILFRLQARLFNYWSPLCHLRLEELCTLPRRGANRHIGHCRKLRLHVGLRKARDDDVVKLRNNVLGCADGCDEGGPRCALDLRKSCLSHGRDFR